MPETTEDTIKPYEGPPATPENFTKAYPEFEAAARSSELGAPGKPPAIARNPLDAVTQKNLNESRRQVRVNPFKAATVINLHPWALQSQDMYLRGIIVPACPPGQDYAYHYIRATSMDPHPTEEGHRIFSPIRPIDKATQFLIKFADPEMYGGGVVVFEGDKNPNKVQDVELYARDGRPIVDSVDGYEYDDEGNRLLAKLEQPHYGKLAELLEQARHERNELYLRRVIEADEWFKSQDSKDRRKITPMHRLMAEVLVAEGILEEAPDWNLASRLDKSRGEAKHCKQCDSVVQGSGYKCTNASCGNILDALAAFMDGGIEWGHGKIDLLPADQYALAEAEHKRRQEAKKARKEQAKETTK